MGGELAKISYNRPDIMIPTIITYTILTVVAFILGRKLWRFSRETESVGVSIVAMLICIILICMAFGVLIGY